MGSMRFKSRQFLVCCFVVLCVLCVFLLSTPAHRIPYFSLFCVPRALLPLGLPLHRLARMAEIHDQFDTILILDFGSQVRQSWLCCPGVPNLSIRVCSTVI